MPQLQPPDGPPDCWTGGNGGPGTSDLNLTSLAGLAATAAAMIALRHLGVRLVDPVAIGVAAGLALGAPIGIGWQRVTGRPPRRFRDLRGEEVS